MTLIQSIVSTRKSVLSQRSVPWFDDAAIVIRIGRFFRLPIASTPARNCRVIRSKPTTSAAVSGYSQSKSIPS